MYQKAEKTKKNGNSTVTKSVAQKKSNGQPDNLIEDNRVDVSKIHALQLSINNTRREGEADSHIQNAGTLQLKKPKRKFRRKAARKKKKRDVSRQQSKAQRAYNAFSSYRSDFFSDNDVTVGQVKQFLDQGYSLHGHGSDPSTDSGENLCTKQDANTFIGWHRKNF